MKSISNKQYAEYQQYLRDKRSGKILTLLGLKTICEANDYDEAKIGKHFLSVLANLADKIPTPVDDETERESMTKRELWMRLFSENDVALACAVHLSELYCQDLNDLIKAKEFIEGKVKELDEMVSPLDISKVWP